MDFIFDPSLVLYLPFYELDGASFTSKDGYGHLCTVAGALWTPQGRSFDGSDDEVTCGAAASSLDVTGSGLTLEAWINPADKGAALRLFHKTGATGGYYLRTPQDYLSGNYKFYVYIDGAWRTLQVTSVVQYGVWQHIVVTYDGSYLWIFKDGIEKVSALQAGSITSSSDTVLTIGSGGGEYFKGNIGEVRIYNRALTPAEIQRNFETTKWRYK